MLGSNGDAVIGISRQQECCREACHTCTMLMGRVSFAVVTAVVEALISHHRLTRVRQCVILALSWINLVKCHNSHE